MNISCYAEDCSRPVAGQCPGYRGSCGRFYCKKHSLDRLCGECASRREADRIEQEYTDLAQGVHKEIGLEMLGPLLLFFMFVFVPSLFFLGNSQDNVVMTWIGLTWLVIGGVIGWVNLARRRARLMTEMMAEAEKEHKGFGEFYAVWKINKDRAALKQAAMILAIGTVAVVASVVGSQEDRIERDVRDIKNRLD